MEKWIKWADIVIVATPDKYLNEKATKLAKNKLVNRADDLIKGNIAIPSVFLLMIFKFLFLLRVKVH